MTQHRFRFFGVRSAEGRWVIRDPEEMTHLTRVLRLAAGTAVEATDGAGAYCEGVLEAITKGEATIAVEEEGFREPPQQTIVLALGALKHGAFDEILPGLVELGVDAVHLFLQEGADKTRLAPKAIERWARIAAQALKQCKRVYRPAIVTHGSLQSFLRTFSEEPRRAGLVLAPGAELGLLSGLTAGFAPGSSAGVALVVGSEQGLNEAELQSLAVHGFTGVHCGDGILRAVTAAVAACAAAAFVRG